MPSSNWFVLSALWFHEYFVRFHFLIKTPVNGWLLWSFYRIRWRPQRKYRNEMGKQSQTPTMGILPRLRRKIKIHMKRQNSHTLKCVPIFSILFGGFVPLFPIRIFAHFQFQSFLSPAPEPVHYLSRFIRMGCSFSFTLVFFFNNNNIEKGTNDNRTMGKSITTWQFHFKQQLTRFTYRTASLSAAWNG